MFFRAAVGVPLLLSTLASAATNGTYPASTTTNLHCTTKMGRHSACPVPTCTKLWTVEAPPVIIPSYTQTTLTHTGNASTITSTETIQATATVTASTITDTFSTTSSEYDTITETTSTTTTFTETDTVTTTSTFTSVVPTESGFQFVSDTLNGYPGTAQKRNNWNQLEARGANSTEHGVPKKDYPQSVECSAEIMVQSTKMVTVTLSPTITIVTPVPSSTTVQTTTTSTSTIVPGNVTTTASFSTTETLTATTTLSFTETATTTTTVVAAAAATSLAACSADNIVGPVGNRYIYNVFNMGPNAATIYDFAQTTSSYDCCTLCINKVDCTGTAWQNGGCYLLHNPARTCDSQSSTSSFFIASDSYSSGYQVSNGNCGYLYDYGNST